jgi:membrane protein DedA with SNARE-associated domain
VKPLWLVIAVAAIAWLVLRWRRHGLEAKVALPLVAAGSAVYGLGLVHLPNLEKLIQDIGTALGQWTYVLVGLLAFLETGAFVGLVAPGETAILVGGVVAGQGKIDVFALIAIVWACAVAGDSVSFYLGRRLGREFLVKHGERVKITEARLHQVEELFQRHGGKMILAGRFVGLVRAIQPFVAGASKMPYRRFIPYDVIGAGLWGTTFVLLGYIFWQSFSQVENYAKKGALALATVIVVVGGAIAAFRYLRVEENRRRAKAWIDEQAERPWLRPVARVVRPVWHRVLVPAGRAVAGPARFAWNRLTPGELGLELTTLLAVAGVGAFVFVGELIAIQHHRLTPGDRRVADLVDHLQNGTVIDVAKVLTNLGTLSVSGTIVGLSALLVVVQRRAVLEAAALVSGMVLTVIAVHLTKAATDRPRPADALVDTMGSSFPSGHAAYAVGLVAAAVVVTRTMPGVARTVSLVTIALVLAVIVGATRIYLRVHYFSDVVAGEGLAAAIFSACGIVALVIAYVRHNGAPRS